ncbi:MULTISPECIES: ABC transporter substrate-binding protein [unclassified Campylobacter]|uniref:ABC transporter substrate-binding protein n=1 Tax=unclassified Campylobacter TaxID=2593542 RepID=UPI0022E9EE1C|nr:MULTISPECIES: ABC transporter substrate-binding protein [unclassified Campylobacter]MDA3055178.1 ABC transporter substrate-binding protein [Campylobacter sp. VBCF_07 NA4]MDA3061430.1 ABC transporter substrate-binding protein [Campylobacter sp. VBCF_02 NA5]MDA3070947.1 ABC transporter substrate-binding protein [Campylobacter sp. VBCF_08 NA3]WBR54087.1 ABC transporter substrate-binding protein [Campylobacter sp. VBCF_01 NA2]
MSKILNFTLLSIVCAGSLCAKQITDQLGRNVEIKDEVSKIVVLQHQSLNVLNQIGAIDKVVGVLESWEKQLGKNYARLAPSLKEMPVAGDLKQVNFESVLALKPDVVIVTNYLPKEQINKLDELKIPVVAMSFFKGGEDNDKVNPTFEDDEKAYNEGFYEGVELLGNIANKEKEATELIEYIKNSQAELKAKMSQIDTKNRVKIYMANPDLTTYGSGKYTGIMFERAGGENVAKKDIKGYKQISAEKLLSYNPDIIFVQERYPGVPDELKSNPLLKELSAIKEGKIFLMPEYVKAWGYPTPEAMALGEEWLARLLYPQNFENNFDEKVEDYYKKFYKTSYK